MHETALVRDLLNQVEQLMVHHGAERAVAIRVGIGAFSGVECELFESAYAILSDASRARGAELTLQRVPLEAQCAACGHEFAVDKFRFQCPACASQDVRVVRGDELILESVTLDAAHA